MRLRTYAIVAAFLVVGFGRQSTAQESTGGSSAAAITPATTLTVFAAASLTAAFQAVANAFEQEHPTVKVQFNFAGSSSLVEQIKQGAPADVFASADEANMQKLVEAGEVAGAPQLFARNRLQIVVPAGNLKHIATLADLAKPGLTIALCGQPVPCGRYAAEAFAKAGVTAPTASQELDVKGVLNKVTMGEADAGIVYATDMRAAGGNVEGVDIPESSNVIARYPIAMMKNAPNPASAVFVEFVLSPEGQQLLASFGFLPR